METCTVCIIHVRAIIHNDIERTVASDKLVIPTTTPKMILTCGIALANCSSTCFRSLILPMPTTQAKELTMRHIAWPENATGRTMPYLVGFGRHPNLKGGSRTTHCVAWLVG